MMDPSAIGEFADDIYTAIRAVTPPVGLTSILAFVDMTQRVLLTRDELADRLRGLVDAGLVVEVEPHRYRDAAGQAGDRSFSGVSAADYAAACEEYAREVEQVYADDREFPANLTIFLPSGGEPLAEAIAVRINQALHDRGGEDILPIGGSLTDGTTNEMEIFALADDLLDAILPQVIEALANESAPPGSTISRWNEVRQEDEIVHRVGED